MVNSKFHIISKKLKFNIYELNLLVIITGYPIISFLPDILQIDTQIITIPFRAFTVLLSLITLYLGVLRHRAYKTSRITKTLIFFWLLYLGKIIFNLVFGPDVHYSQPKENYLFWALALTFIPMLSSRFIQMVDFTKLAQKVLYILAVLLAFSIFNNKSILQTTIDSRINGNSALNTISYGHLGITLSLISLFFLDLKGKNIIYILTFLLGIYIMIISGSRSPVVAFLGATIFLAVIRRNKWVITALVSVGITLAVGFTAFLSFFNSINPVFVNRLTGLIVDKELSGRNSLYYDAIDDFLQYPFTGKHFLLSHGTGEGFYPHNSIIEAFMALGAFGGLLFVYLVFKALMLCGKFFKTKKSFGWVGLVFIQSFFLGLASGSLWGGQVFWIEMMLLFAIYDKQIYLGKRPFNNNLHQSPQLIIQ